MTRDDVIEEVAIAVEKHADILDDADLIAASVRAMKSKPPAKPPEVENRDAFAEPVAQRLLAQLTAAQNNYSALLAQRDAEYVELIALRERVVAQEKRAEEALARVKHMEWVMDGAKMQGET